jgi:hypothetical protein
MEDADMDTMQGLWVGPRLSTMEQLSIASFLAHGHPYHLYVYEDVTGVPAGAEVKDANEILPASRIFRYANGGSYAGFSNLFRYQLLRDRGNWWVDLDMVCLRPFDFADPIVISSERVADGCRFVNCGALKFPAGSPAMEAACTICTGKDPDSLVFGETGPSLMEWLVERHSLEAAVQEPEVFCPIPCEQFDELMKPDGRIPGGAYAVHLWHEIWRQQGFDKDGEFPPHSIYGRLSAAFASSARIAV